MKRTGGRVGGTARGGWSGWNECGEDEDEADGLINGVDRVNVSVG